MEVAGVACGALPLILMTFQGYRIVRNFETEYNSFNHKLRSILRDISTEGSLFKYTFNVILAETVIEDERKLMLENPQSEYWARHDLHEEIERVLGDLFLPTVESLYGVQETLQEIRSLLLVLSGNQIHLDGKSSSKNAFKHLTMNVAAIATSVLHSDPLGLHFKNIQIQSTTKKLVSLAKDHRGALEVLRNQLRDHNRTLRTILNLHSNPRSASRTKIAPVIHQAPSGLTMQTSVNEPHGVATSDTDTRGVQQASQKLHRMISGALSCDCHIAYLCLERLPSEATTAKHLKGKSPQSPTTEPLTTFAFRLSTAGSPRVSTASRQEIHLVFSSRGPRPTDMVTIPGGVLPAVTFCKLARSDGYETYLYDTGGSCGFLLQRVTPPTGWADISHSISLEDLVESRPAELRSLDCFLIAIKLAYALLHFYCSPWVRDWSLNTIHFFEQHEQSDTSPGRWTPYLALTPNAPGSRQLGDRNKDIYLLGIILLQLGRKKRLQFSDAENEELTLQKALVDLCQEMGLQYKAFVQNCLVLWSGRNTDLMGTGNLDVFLSHIRVLQDAAKGFLSE